MGRAGRGMEAEAYFYWGWTGRGCGGGRATFHYIFPWLGRQDVYVAHFPVGVPNL